MPVTICIIFDRAKLATKIANISATTEPIWTRLSPLERGRKGAFKEVKDIVLIGLRMGKFWGKIRTGALIAILYRLEPLHY